MREILFRAKRTDNGEWIEGYLNQHRGRVIFDCCCNAINSYDYYINDYAEKFDTDLYGCVYKVIPETVGQYTGLTDKNGVRIFEGDIVKCLDTINDIEFNAVVEFGNPNHEYNWGYQLKHISGDMPNLDILCWVDMEETGAFIEVIGNIYDSPELLETAAKPAAKNIAQSTLAPATENFELMEG